MKIKRFEAATAEEALAKVKRDLGPEAVILYTKHFRRGGLFGIFGREVVEITAGSDLNLAETPAPRPTAALRAPEPRTEAAPQTRLSVLSGAGRPPADLKKLRVRSRELNEMKVVASPARRGKPAAGRRSFPSSASEELAASLVKSGVSEDLASRLVHAVLEGAPESEKAEPAALRARLRAHLAGFIRAAASLKPRPDGPSVVAFVGPTGVGKTTTLAKLAARAALMEGRSVALITADTYRVAAAEQLKTYARIIGCPVEVVSKTDEVKGALDRHRDKQLILIDTAGRSPRHEGQLTELKELIDAARPDEIHLIISATTKYYDVLGVVERFGVVPVNRVLFSKTDETASYGLMLNVAANFGFPISFLTTGQKVPDDIEPADPGRIADLVLAGPAGRDEAAAPASLGAALG